MFRRILVAYDGSPSAQLALEQAFDLSRAEHVERVTIFSAVRTVNTMIAMAGGQPEVLQAEIEAEVVGQLNAARDAAPADVPVATAWRVGPAGKGVLRAAERDESDLIVMGSRGHGPVSSALLGSVSTYVLHHAHVAVLVAHAPAATATPVDEDALAAAGAA
jgi:nucleotide-binding universal stress UspA family protein